MSKVGTKNYLRNNGFVAMVSSIMASDSPTSDYKDAFTYPAAGAAGRSTPPPTTSYLSAKQEIEPGPAVSKPDKEDEVTDGKGKEGGKDKDKDELDMSSPDANPGYKPPDNESKSEKRADFKDDGKGDAKMNGGDKLEAQFMLPLDTKDKDDSDEESCTVNCLYYTMQCCECTIT